MRPGTWSLLAAIAVIGSSVFSSASPSAAQETDATLTVPTTIPARLQGVLAFKNLLRIRVELRWKTPFRLTGAPYQ